MCYTEIEVAFYKTVLCYTGIRIKRIHSYHIFKQSRPIKSEKVFSVLRRDSEEVSDSADLISSGSFLYGFREILILHHSLDESMDRTSGGIRFGCRN